MLVANPSLVRVRLELARAFFLKEEDTSRPAAFRDRAGRPGRRPRWRSTSTASSHIIRARKRWSVRVGVALAPDSNLSANTEETDDPDRRVRPAPALHL